LEPDNALGWDLLSWALGYEQPPDALQSEKAAREALRLEPNSAASQYHLGRALIFEGRYDDAAAAFRRAKEIGSNSYEGLGMGQLALAQGNYDQAIGHLMSTGVASKTAMDQYWISSAYAGKGDKEKALVALQNSFKLGFGDFGALDASPYFKSLRDDPRYRQLVQQYRKK
jgi:tetratricopeptide (TPR) repeat protein